jgi:hypothetical protein
VTRLIITHPRRRGWALGVLSVALALAGCSTTTAASTTTTPSTVEITTTTVHSVPQYVTVGGHKVLVPTENHHEPINSYSSFGQNVIITSKGFEPYKLYAASSTPIVFTNLTSKVQDVHFYHFPNLANSGPIPSGGSFSMKYDAAIDIVYGNRTGTLLGHLYIGGCPPTCG